MLNQSDLDAFDSRSQDLLLAINQGTLTNDQVGKFFDAPEDLDYLQNANVILGLMQKVAPNWFWAMGSDDEGCWARVWRQQFKLAHTWSRFSPAYAMVLALIQAARLKIEMKEPEPDLNTTVNEE